MEAGARRSRGVSARLVAGSVALGALTLALATVEVGAQSDAGARGWPQWGGPSRNFLSNATGLADSWPTEGPPEIWSRSLGVGHSAILVDDGRLYTMYRRGNGREKSGPWEADEIVIAMDAATGDTIWEYTYPAPHEPYNFTFGAGPHSTPLLVGDRLFAIGTNKQLYALDKRTGDVLWSHDFVEEFGAPTLLIRPVVNAGYGCSPIAYRDTIICSVGGPGQAVMAFRQTDGTVVWKSGDFLTSPAPPILISVDGQEQLVIFAGQTINGLDPATGGILWSHPHDPSNDLNMTHPLWGEDNILFVSSAYTAGSRALRLRRQGGTTAVEELWYSSKERFMFLNAIRLGDHVYGTTGDFGPAFLTAVDVRTGEPAWRARGFSRASLLYADGKAIILDEDGDLALARLTPEGVTVLSQARIFETTAWTIPTLVGTTLYARDREKIVALDVGASDAE